MQVRSTVRKRQLRSGFTLLEVLLVLAILGVIAAMVVPQLLGRQKEANVKATKVSINRVETALELYAQDHYGEYPQGGQEVLLQLTEPEQLTDGRTREPYLKEMPKDAWEKPLNYEYPNSRDQNATYPRIWSMGPNGQDEDGGGDDISNMDDELEV